VPESSEARYRVRETLAGRSLPSDAVGATKDISGQIVVDSTGKVVKDASRISVNLANLKSDQDRRDNFLRQNTLETARYPEVVFVPTEVRGLPSPLPTSGEVTFEILGDLTVKGVTKPTTWQATATVEGDEVQGKAQTSFTFNTFGMSQPRVALVLSIEDNIRLEIDFLLRRLAD
jgi:polyisoprenoid-binding protein YceI